VGVGIFRGVAAGLVPALGNHKGAPLHIGVRPAHGNF